MKNVVAARLREARKAARFTTAGEAAAALGIEYPTYAAHENGSRKFDLETAALYARRFKVSLDWLSAKRGIGPLAEVPLVGYVGAGAVAHYYRDTQGDLDMVPAPDDVTPNTVAVEVRGESLGPLFEHWLVYYDEVRSPVTPDLYGRLCIVWLPDDRVLIKQIRPSKTPGFYHLLSNTEPTMTDVEVSGAARVKSMVPR